MLRGRGSMPQHGHGDTGAACVNMANPVTANPTSREPPPPTRLHQEISRGAQAEDDNSSVLSVPRSSTATGVGPASEVYTVGACELRRDQLQPQLFALLYTLLASAIVWPFAWPRLRDGTPPRPDYGEANSWDALPSSWSCASVVPAECGESQQATAPVDVFYIHPTSFMASQWNAPIDDLQANLLTGAGQLTQQASAFNGVAKVYAPRYRQVSQSAQGTDDLWNTGQNRSHEADPLQRAMDYAYSDVQDAFEHFLPHNEGRPLILASHSQGTMHAKRLLNYAAAKHPYVLKRLVAAYLLGNTIAADGELPVPICGMASQTGCFVSWNTLIVGADASHWLDKLPTGVRRAACVNPLTWRNDTETAPHSLAMGAMPVTGHLFLTSFDEHLIDASCSKEGMLFVSNPAPAGGWGYIADMTFPAGGELHAYDYPLFYRDIRYNAWIRTKAFLDENAEETRQTRKNSRGQSPPTNSVDPPPTNIDGLAREHRSCSCGFACGWTFFVHVVLVMLGGWLICAVVFAPCHLVPWCLWQNGQSAGRCPNFEQICWRATMCCCCPWHRCCSNRCNGAPNRNRPRNVSPPAPVSAPGDKHVPLARG